MEKKFKYGLLILAILIIFTIIIAETVYVGANKTSQPSKIIGSDSLGYVTKVTYNSTEHPTAKIAIITGMHPREISAKEVVPKVIDSYTRKHNVEIVNYKVNVTAYPENFYTGRNNGESLVAKYVVPDIAKSNYSLVIICHNHEKGYGIGYYIATPSMDTKSLKLAEAHHSVLTDFRNCQRDTTKKAESTSIENVDDPIVATGTPVFVYEIPEEDNDTTVFYNTNRLIDAAFKVI